MKSFDEMMNDRRSAAERLLARGPQGKYRVGDIVVITGRNPSYVGLRAQILSLQYRERALQKGYRDYTAESFEMFYWRSTSQFEVDFVKKTKHKKLIGIEVKAHRKSTNMI